MLIWSQAALQELKLTKLTPCCGAEVAGVDLAQPLDGPTRNAITTALADYCVLFFANQPMTVDELKALGRQFGQLHVHPAWPRVYPGHPEVMEIYADENTKRIGGEDWHSDVSCDAEPPMGTILHMLEIPPVGGDTLFANMHAAFESLSDQMRRFLEGLTAVHDGEHVYRRRFDNLVEQNKPYPKTEHPLIRTHPVSGRKALFVNRIFTTRIVQLSKVESDTVLRMLFEHIERPEHQCRFHWQPESVAFWDNRCAQHHALWDYYPHRRHALRVTIKGDAPY